MDDLKTPHWIEHPHESGENWEYSMYECSDCHEWFDNDSNYCPNCGVKMKQEGWQ
jgi:predicted amidophosphoribosyltransferase